MSSERRFVSEPIQPDADTFADAGGGPGTPLLPRRFDWRGRTYEIAAIVRTWKTTDAGHRTAGDAYLRRHWADVDTRCGARMRLYVERGGRPRWYLHSHRP